MQQNDLAGSMGTGAQRAVFRVLRLSLGALFALACVSFVTLGTVREAQAGSRFPNGVAVGLGAAAIVGLAAAAMAQQQSQAARGAKSAKSRKPSSKATANSSSSSRGKKKGASPSQSERTDVAAKPEATPMPASTLAPDGAASLSYARSSAAPSVGEGRAPTVDIVKPVDVKGATAEVKPAAAPALPLPVTLVTDIGE